MKMKAVKKAAALGIALAVFLSAGSGVFAADGDDNFGEWNSEWEVSGENTETGQCGDNLSWSLNKETGVLRISGSGDMWNRSEHDSNLWDSDSVNAAELEGNITSIGSGAFQYSMTLKQITIPGSVRTIGDSAFLACHRLTSVTLSGALQSIGAKAFYGCWKLQTIALPSELESIGELAFSYSGLTEAVLPSSVKLIGRSAFEVCEGLTKITVPDNCANYRSVDGVLYNADKTVLICVPSGRTGDFAVPASVRRIEYRAFSYSKLSSITLPDAIEEIGEGAFLRVFDLKTITLPDSLTTISDCAFLECKSLKSVRLSPQTSTIGSYAFQYCHALSDFELPSSVREIGEAAFSECSSLKNISLPEGLKQIETQTFNDCTSLEKIDVPKSVDWIDAEAFRGCSSLKSVTLPNPQVRICPNVFFGCDAVMDYYFAGTEYQWEAIVDKAYIVLADGASVHCNYNEILITEQPKDTFVTPGKKATFALKATGSGLTYQWYYKKKPAPGYATSIFEWKGHTTPSTSAIANDSWDGMLVYCQITDENGNWIVSNKVTVTTVIPLTITQQPQNISVKTGDIATFTVKATGKKITCQWYYKKSGASAWSLWKGHDTFTTKATANVTWDGMQVYCVIKDVNGDTVSSDPATITLTDTLSITSHPSDVTANVGDTVKFTVQAQGIGLKYQWYYRKSGAASWSVWKNHTTASTSAVANDTWDGMRVYCKVEDKNGHSQNTESAIIQLNGMPKITVQPADLQTKPGETVIFSVKAQGSALKYQWYYKKFGAKCWSPWKNHTTASTSAIANDTWNGMQVYCVITDGFGRSVSSDPSTVQLLS